MTIGPLQYRLLSLILTGLTQTIKQYATCRGQMPFAPTRYGVSA